MTRIDPQAFTQSLLGGMNFGAGVVARGNDQALMAQQAAEQNRARLIREALDQKSFDLSEKYQTASMENMQADNDRLKMQFDQEMEEKKEQASQVLKRKEVDARLTGELTKRLVGGPQPNQPNILAGIDLNDLQNASPHVRKQFMEMGSDEARHAAEMQETVATLEGAKTGGVLKQALAHTDGKLYQNVEKFNLWHMISPDDIPLSVQQRKEGEEEETRMAMIYDMAIEKDPATGAPISNLQLLEQLSQYPAPVVKELFARNLMKREADAKAQAEQAQQMKVAEALSRQNNIPIEQAQDLVTLQKNMPGAVKPKGDVSASVKLGAAKAGLSSAMKKAEQAQKDYAAVALALRGEKTKNDSPPSEDDKSKAAKGKADYKRLVDAWQAVLAARGEVRDRENDVNKSVQPTQSSSPSNPTKAPEDFTETEPESDDDLNNTIDGILNALNPPQ